jgi:hypothetical protein
MEDGAVGLGAIPMAGDTLKLPPRLAAGMPVRAQVAASEPAVIGAILIRTEARLRVNRSTPSSGENQQRWWLPRRLGMCLDTLLTGRTQWFADESSVRLGLFGALAFGFIRLGGRLKWRGWIIAPPDMEHTIDEHQSDEQEVIKP